MEKNETYRINIKLKTQLWYHHEKETFKKIYIDKNKYSKDRKNV